MVMKPDIAPITDADYVELAGVLRHAFGEDWSEQELEDERPLVELDRTLAARHDGRIVGSAAAFSMQVAVPGALLPMAGVTWVGVLPTHRRQGLLTALMRHQLDDVHQRREALAGLWASESVIYGRFGYGMAAPSARLSIPVRRVRLQLQTGGPRRVRLVDRDEALARMPEPFDRALPQTPGMMARTAAWYEAFWRDREYARHGMSTLRYALYENADGHADGYAVYRVRQQWEDHAENELYVRDLIACTPAAYAAVWHFLLSHDLSETVRANNCRRDEPLIWMVDDPRRLQLTVRDGLWLRLIDVPQALEGRRYNGDGMVVFEVTDAFCPWNAGRWRLEAADGLGGCAATSDSADIVLDVADLAAVYLGGVSFTVLAQAGRAFETRRGELERADALFASLRSPCVYRVV